MKSVFKKIIVSILTWESGRVLRKYRPKVIGITGSVGKTTTKDAIYSVLKDHFHVRKSEKSYNSEIGVPLTILGCENAWSNPFLWIGNILRGLMLIFFRQKYPEWLILEIGLDSPGDIERTVKWLSLDVAVFTTLAKLPVHVEFFDSPESLRAEKKKLVDGLKQGGILVNNIDDPYLRNITLPSGGRIVTYGIKEGVDVAVKGGSVTYSKGKYHFPTGMTFKLVRGGKMALVKCKDILGSQHVYPLLAATAVGHALGIDISKSAGALSSHVPSPGRLRLISGIDKTLLIDDTYNSSPIAMKAALSVLRDIAVRGRKIAILGDMMELGKHTADAHKQVGKQAAGIADILVTVGPRAEFIALSAEEHGMRRQNIFSFNTSENAAPKVRRMLEKGDLVLIKGSQSPRLEYITKALMAEPDKAPKLLVRQDSVWLKKQ